MRIWAPGYCKSRYGGIAFASIDEGFKDVPGFSTLSLRSRARLYLLLCKARRRYDGRRPHDLRPASSAVAAEIKDVLQSLSRVAKFGRDALDSDFLGDSNTAVADSPRGSPNEAGQNRKRKREVALTILESAAEAWAATLPLDKLPDGFQRQHWEVDGITKMEHSAWAVIFQFFRTASLIEQFAKGAEVQLRARKDGKLQLSSIEWLAGHKLPRVFETIFKPKKFTVTVDAYGGISPGVSFVIAALATMGLQTKSGGRFSANTIKAHRRAAKKYPEG